MGRHLGVGPHQLGGTSALSHLLEELSSDGLTTLFTDEGEPVPLPPSYDLCLYRAVQEGLTNALRHGQASQVEVSLEYGKEVILSLVDNGRGAKEKPTRGMGLRGIYERSAELGGTLQVWTAPGQGFRLVVRLPWPYR